MSSSAENKPFIIDVLPAVAIDRTYSYRLDQEWPPEMGQIVSIPLGKRLVSGVVIRVLTAQEKENEGDVPDPDALKSIVKVHDHLPALSSAMLALIDWVARYTLAQRGMILRMVLPSEAGLEPLPNRQALKRTKNEPERMTEARQKVLDILQDGLMMERASLTELADVSPSVIKSLMDQHILESVDLPPKPVVDEPDLDFLTHAFTSEQQSAIDDLVKKVTAQAGEKNLVTLLEGVTGSGKTEVYFEAVAEVVRLGKQCLILMPEIALTTRFLERFRKRFGVLPGTWHSNLSVGQRARMWQGVLKGDVPVVIGARSSLFLPFKDLGLIIIDEEHEQAYKQEDRVIYHARDMAVVRAHEEKVPLILVSATPSLESLLNVEQGKYDHVKLAERYGETASLPVVTPIDMRSIDLEKGFWISDPLKREMKENLEAEQQSLLFLNRRGFAPLTLCNACGYRFICHQCSSWLVEHRFKSKLVCHHCGFERHMPKACPDCKTQDSLIPCGPGIERIAEEVSEIFPHARQALLSSDIEGGLEALGEQIDLIERGEIDIIIGTQLVAKGYHFPKLTLVGILDVDVSLSLADLRAAERSFQLLSQVAGRAGRVSDEGRALIQTYMPDHPVIKALATYDQKAFYKAELEARKSGAMPPFSRLAGLVVSAKEKDLAQSFARQLLRSAPQQEQIRVLGPTEAPLALIRGRFRYRLLVQSPKAFDLSGYIQNWLAQGPQPHKSVRVHVDIDPLSFL